MDICFIFNFSTERKLNPYSFFDIGRNNEYFNLELTKKTFGDDIQNQLPLLEYIIETSKRKDFKFSIYTSGLFLELLSAQNPGIIVKLKKLLDLDKLELLGGTYYNSVSSLYSLDLFKNDVEKHKKLIKSMFDYIPVNFTNSKNIYNNSLSEVISTLKFKSIIVPLIDWFLGDRNANQAYLSSDQKLTLLLSDYRRTKSIFNSDFKLTDGLVVAQVNPTKNIFEKNLAATLHSIKSRKTRFLTVNESISEHQSNELYHMPETVAMNSSGQELSFFTGNSLQIEILEKIKSIKNQLHSNKDNQLIDDLISLSAAENFLASCTKIDSSEISEPYDNYLQMMNILADMEIRMYRNKIS
ncbi:MAG: hypothetical protein NWS46_09340 [Cyclobacteriaceae bacterium]|jgi:alpha-amylase|nr:hypothetical protein [Cyclobacteriaceae bacterium]